MLRQATDRPANTSSSHIRRGDLAYAALVGVRVPVASSLGRGRGRRLRAERLTGVRKRGDPAPAGRSGT